MISIAPCLLETHPTTRRKPCIRSIMMFPRLTSSLAWSISELRRAPRIWLHSSKRRAGLLLNDFSQHGTKIKCNISWWTNEDWILGSLLPCVSIQRACLIFCHPIPDRINAYVSRDWLARDNTNRDISSGFELTLNMNECIITPPAPEISSPYLGRSPLLLPLSNSCFAEITTLMRTTSSTPQLNSSRTRCLCSPSYWSRER